MGIYEKAKKVVADWKDGEYILSRGYKMDCYPEKIYGIRDKIKIDGDILIYSLWDTEIFNYDRRHLIITLDTGGWKTKLTRERMNTIFNILNMAYHVDGSYETRRNSAGTWYLVDEVRKNSNKFQDTITLYLISGFTN